MKFHILKLNTYMMSFIDGLIGLLTLGFYCPYCSVKANIKLLDYIESFENNYEQFR
jgi:hypothetical protein